MENIVTEALQSGNVTAIALSLAVYLLIYFQRKDTSKTRDEANKKLQDEIAELKKENELKQKDIDYLMEDNVGIKQDIKEIKATLQTMALALERIAAKYDND